MTLDSGMSIIYRVNILSQWLNNLRYWFVISVFGCDQAALWMVQSVCPSVRLSVCPSVCHTFLTMFLSSYHHEIFRSYYQWQKWCPCKRSRSEVQGQGHRGHNPTLPFPVCNSSLKFTYDDEMMHIAWLCLGEVPYCFSRSSVKFFFKVTRLQKSSNLTQIGRFRTVTPVWIHQWLRNAAQSLK